MRSLIPSLTAWDFFWALSQQCVARSLGLEKQDSSLSFGMTRPAMRPLRGVPAMSFRPQGEILGPREGRQSAAPRFLPTRIATQSDQQHSSSTCVSNSSAAVSPHSSKNSRIWLMCECTRKRSSGAGPLRGGRSGRSRCRQKTCSGHSVCGSRSRRRDCCSLPCCFPG